MKRGLLIAVILLLVASVLALGCAKQAPATAPPKTEEITIIKAFTAAFGTGTYAIFTAIEKLAATHPRIRVSQLETSGYAYGNMQMADEKNGPARWKDHVMGINIVAVGLGVKGLPPFDKPYPRMAEMQVLFTHSLSSYGLATLDPELAKDCRKLTGKRVAVGQKGALGWGWETEQVILAHGIEAKLDWLTPDGAIAALLDGRTDASVIGGYASGDFKSFEQAPAFAQLAASGRKFYYVKFDPEVIKAYASKQGFLISQGVFPANMMPQQPEPWVVYYQDASCGCHKTFPEQPAYDLVKLVLDNYKVFGDYAAVGKLCTPATMITMVKDFGKEGYHPGAIKAYTEYGIWPK